MENFELFFEKDSNYLEDFFFKKGIKLIVGLDEAGRGPLAGPVVAAAVVLPPNFQADWLKLLDDSKRLTPQRREFLFGHIVGSALAVGTAYCSAAEIDSLNILKASLKAMGMALQQVVRRLSEKPQLIIIDGKHGISNPYGIREMPVVKADSKSLNVAAASVIAKVFRDRMMETFHQLFPEYNFARHKGYPTKEHLEKLREFGPSPIHRLSFRGVLGE